MCKPDLFFRQKVVPVSQNAQIVQCLLLGSLGFLATISWTGCSEDATSPSATRVELISPITDEELSGVVEIQADVENANSVRFEIDGDVLTVRSSPPYDFRWNSRQHPNGVFELAVIGIGVTNNSKDTAEITINNIGVGAVSVRLHPETASVGLEQQFRFDGTVFGAFERSIRWTVVGGEEFGSVDFEGVYTAPSEIPRPPKALIIAQSAADPARFAEAHITIHH